MTATATVLPRDVWRQQQAEHADRVDALTAAHRQRRQRGAAHPVEDFLYRYYPIRPGQLRRWHPGVGVVLDAAGEDWQGRPGYLHLPERPGAVTADAACFTSGDLRARGDHLRRVREMLDAMGTRPPKFGCFGLHEWAMVHGLSQAEVRHASWPLRVTSEQVSAAVDEVGLRCTHFDAFRFFTDTARGLNATVLTPADRSSNEQPGCLHATMDLYRWAFEAQPLTSSDLVLRCFSLAAHARVIDMRASPYDLLDLGYEPIPVETPAGRATYAAEQRRLATAAAPLRQEILTALAVMG